MLATYYTGDLAPINQARTADYEAQTRRMGTDQAYLLGLLQGVNQGRQVGVNEKQVDTGGLLGGLNYRLGQDQVGARNRETDVRERLGNEQIAFNRDQLATEAALRSTELSDRDRQYFAGLADAAKAREDYLKSGVGAGTLAPGVQIELLRDAREQKAMQDSAAEIARQINMTVDKTLGDYGTLFNYTDKDIQSTPKLRLKVGTAVNQAMQALPNAAQLVVIDPITFRATPRQFSQAPSGGLMDGVVQPVRPNNSPMLRSFLGRPFDPTLMLRQ